MSIRRLFEAEIPVAICGKCLESVLFRVTLQIIAGFSYVWIKISSRPGRELEKTTTFKRDNEDRVTKATDPNGNETVYSYDDKGNVLQTVDAYGNKTTNMYDDYNNLLTTKDANGNVTSYAYDGSGNVTQVIVADGTKVESTYTQDNLVSSVKNDGSDRHGNEV